MRILVPQTLPPAKELAETLKQEFCSDYAYQLFGPTAEKDVIVRKSTLVGVRISKKDHEITISGTYPSLKASILSILSFYFLGLGNPLLSLSWKRFEREIGTFLNQKYNRSW